MIDNNKLYNDFYELDTNDYFGVIKLYEQNSLILENRSIFQDKNDFEDFMFVKCIYIISLENTGKYKKTISQAETAIQLIESNLKSYNININEHTTYWSILTSTGRAYYNLKDYNNSQQTFKRLLDWDPENDIFKEWLIASQSEKRKSINKYLYILALFLFLLSFLLESRETKRLLLIFGFLLAITGSINEYFGDKIIAWGKKN